MFNGRRQPSCGGTSRMTREYQVRFCERLGVQFPGPTRRVHQRYGNDSPENGPLLTVPEREPVQPAPGHEAIQKRDVKPALRDLKPSNRFLRSRCSA